MEWYELSTDESKDAVVMLNREHWKQHYIRVCGTLFDAKAAYLAHRDYLVQFEAKSKSI